MDELSWDWLWHFGYIVFAEEALQETAFEHWKMGLAQTSLKPAIRTIV
jgi:hypothetical protein